MAASYRFSGAPRAYAPASVRNYPAEYFSGSDVSIFFDDQHIDEVTSLAFTLTEKVVPIYSYASYTPNRFLQGSRMVQGQFAINMRSGDYLHELLYSQVVRDVSAGQIDINITDLQGAVAPDPNTDPDKFARWVQAQKGQFWDAVSNQIQAGKVPDLSSQPYFVNNGFTILIAYGDIDINDFKRNTGRIRTIENVNIWSANQTIGLAPENIMEVFNFVAADINSDSRSFGQGF